MYFFTVSYQIVFHTNCSKICLNLRFGEPVNINLIRDKDTGKSKGFCFLCYEDQRSTILAVDNFNGIKILNRTIRVDHVAEYKVPKEGKKTDEKTKKLYAEGCASTPAMEIKKSPPRDYRETIADQIEADIKLPERLPIRPIKQEMIEEEDIKLPERLPIRPVKEEVTIDFNTYNLTYIHCFSLSISKEKIQMTIADQEKEVNQKRKKEVVLKVLVVEKSHTLPRRSTRSIKEIK